MCSWGATETGWGENGYIKIAMKKDGTPGVGTMYQYMVTPYDAIAKKGSGGEPLPLPKKAMPLRMNAGALFSTLPGRHVHSAMCTLCMEGGEWGGVVALKHAPPCMLLTVATPAATLLKLPPAGSGGGAYTIVSSVKDEVVLFEDEKGSTYFPAGNYEVPGLGCACACPSRRWAMVPPCCLGPLHMNASCKLIRSLLASTASGVLRGRLSEVRFQPSLLLSVLQLLYQNLPLFPDGQEQELSPGLR